MPVHRHRYAPRQAEILHRRVSGKRVLDGLWRLAFPGVGLVAAGAFAAGRLARRRGYAVIHAHWPLPAGLVALTGAGRAGKAASGRHLSRGGARRLRRQPAAAGSFGDRLRRARRGGGELQ
ncbi:hypothetical protein RxyAA322_26890 [Rubrobacter xylanophilus]|uniref:Uncharacterized protein n=1 Tax=Rubrobacter xylanophilus TaxID=49319 RepID=A0A510HN69_9ACTN|nr:hypothetical protein RxyAA322_26890 [Rubrobacter xylanophilus]